MGKPKVATLPTDSTPVKLHIAKKRKIKNETMSRNITDSLPKGLQVLSNQVAGHMGDGKNVGMLRQNGTVLKPILKPKCGERETKFYEELSKTNDPALIEMKQFVPEYYGNKKIIINSTNIDCIILDDLTKNYKEPCIMDIKIGKRTWDPLAPFEKIINENNKYRQTKAELGFCIPGFQVYNSNGKLCKLDKNFGKNLNKDSVRDALKIFLNGETGLNRSLLYQLLIELWKIQRWAKTQTSIQLIASSLLLIYDAKYLRTPSQIKLNWERTMKKRIENEETATDSLVKIKMIDFAHVFPSSGSVDINYLEGIDNLVKIFEGFLDETD